MQRVCVRVCLLLAQTLSSMSIGSPDQYPHQPAVCEGTYKRRAHVWTSEGCYAWRKWTSERWTNWMRFLNQWLSSCCLNYRNTIWLQVFLKPNLFPSNVEPQSSAWITCWIRSVWSAWITRRFSDSEERLACSVQDAVVTLIALNTFWCEV